jgi:hypothetical protein
MAEVKTRQKKVYDFEIPKVKSALVKVLKKQKNESTIADLISSTGLPKYQVEQTIKIVSNEYRGHLKATESGELLYYFPYGMQNQVKGFIPGLKRFLSGFFDIAGKVLAFLFKVWIMVMLVGYFVLFLAILIAAVVAAIALSFAGNKDSRDRGGSKGGMFFLVIRLFDLFIHLWFYGQLMKGPDAARQKKRGRAMHKAVFAFVFGEPDASETWNTEEKKYVISYIQGKKGVITIEELMAITGKDFDSAQSIINRYMLEFEGEPNVTENGSIVFSFPELMKTAEQTNRSVPLENPNKKAIVPFNKNEKKMNGWIAFFNGANILFGSYFLYFYTVDPTMTLLEPIGNRMRAVIDPGLLFRFMNWVLTDFAGMLVANSSSLIMIALGIVPLVFSIFFYIIPLMRNLQRNGKNEEIKKENLRKRIYNKIFENRGSINPAAVSSLAEVEKPKNPGRFTEDVVKQFAAMKHGEVEEAGAGKFVYTFPDFKYELDDVEKYRQTVDLSKFRVGKTVFDSGE